jgi:hypothetical protein
MSITGKEDSVRSWVLKQEDGNDKIEGGEAEIQLGDISSEMTGSFVNIE